MEYGLPRLLGGVSHAWSTALMQVKSVDITLQFVELQSVGSLASI